MAVTDTSAGARAMQMRVLGAMSGGQRVALAFDMSLLARELAKAGIRADHPGWTDAQVNKELLRLAFLPGLLPAQLRLVPHRRV